MSSNAKQTRLRQTSRNRGITLIEMLVSLVVGGVVLGLVLGILISTKNGVTRSQNRIAMIDAARVTCDAVTRVLDTTVPPNSLDLATTGTAMSSVTLHAPDSCAVISSQRFPGQGIELARITNLSDGGVAIERVDLATVLAQENPEPQYEVVSQDNERFRTTARFRYAQKVRSVGLEADLRDTLAPADYPTMIEVRIRVEDRTGDLNPYELVSAVRLMR